MSLRVYRQVDSLGEVLSEHAVCVLVGTALPRTARVAEENIDVRRQTLDTNVIFQSTGLNLAGLFFL